jgi:hypothetical protein
MRIFASEYSLVCEYLQANISLNVNFALSLVNFRFKTNNLKQIFTSMRQCEANICSEANIRFNMYLFCINWNICMRTCANILKQI